jgi:hypothetical protein
MSLHSSLADFSLAELFQIIDQGRRSGCLELNDYPLDVNGVNSSSLANTKFTEPEMLKINTSFLQNLFVYLRSNIS